MNWKLCTERSPENEQQVMLTFRNSAGLHVGEAFFRNNVYYYVAEILEHYYEEEYDMPIAWAEMPEPFKQYINSKNYTLEELLFELYRKQIKEIEIENVSNCLRGIDIQMIDENGNFRPFNEVMIDLGEKLKNMRNKMERKEFELIKNHILNTICGARYKNEFM